MTADQVQKMVFLLCHNNVRTRGVIAIPTPVRYADLCCYRSKLHIEAQRNLVEVTTATSDHSKQEALEREIIAKLNTLVKINDKLKNQLYYC